MNAMSKLNPNWVLLTPEQRILYNLMQLIGGDDWTKRLHNREPPRDAGLTMNLPITMAMTVAPNADTRHAKPPLQNGRQELLLQLPMSVKERRSKRGQTKKGQELVLNLALRVPQLLMRKSRLMHQRSLHGSIQWRLLDHQRRSTT